MKKTLLFAFGLLLTSLLHAQSFEVKGASDNHKGHIGDLIKVPLSIKNTTQKTLSLVVRRTESQIGSTQKNLFCPDGYCLENSAEEIVIKLEPGQSLESFMLGLEAGLVPGVSTVKYTLINRANPTDYQDIELNFSVEERVAKNDIYSSRFVTVHDVYPNPVSDVAHIEYKLQSDQVKAKIVIHNILGSALSEYPLPFMETHVKIKTEELTPGIYFYTLYLENEGVMTRKLIVRR
ncbi:MAG: T9SS type A sorting domain-containing protein [Cyclobacteriaceae bacterium]|nr:T9SS type A sorting domain-containing protein [Cyclobacteriaceae bacterium]